MKDCLVVNGSDIFHNIVQLLPDCRCVTTSAVWQQLDNFIINIILYIKEIDEFPSRPATENKGK